MPTQHVTTLKDLISARVIRGTVEMDLHAKVRKVEDLSKTYHENKASCKLFATLSVLLT